MKIKNIKTITLSKEELLTIRASTKILYDLSNVLQDDETVLIKDDGKGYDTCYDKGCIGEAFSLMCDLADSDSIMVQKGYNGNDIISF